MTTYEYLTWRQYYNECPFGERFIDYRDALTVKQLLAPHCKSDIPLNDLLLIRPDLEEAQQDPEYLTKKCQAFFGTTEQHEN